MRTARRERCPIKQFRERLIKEKRITEKMIKTMPIKGGDRGAEGAECFL
jgi:uncharacterized protein YneF (UPF0154 family)